MYNFFKKHPKISIILLIIIILGVPLAIQLHLGLVYKTALWFTPGDHGDWMNFWGSYLGIISSGIIAFSVAKFEINNEKKENEKRKKLEILPYVKVLQKGLTHHKFSEETEHEYQDEFNLNFSSYKEYLPIRFVVGNYYCKFNDNTKFMSTCVVGDVFPNSVDDVHMQFTFNTKTTGYSFARLEIKGVLVDNRHIRIEFVKNEQPKYFVKEETKDWEEY